MKDLTIWKNAQFRLMREDMDRLFRDFIGDFTEPGMIVPLIEAATPRVEVSEEKEVVVLRMAFPGLDPADLEISVSPEEVVITANRQEKLSHGPGKLRRSHHFSQRIKLPCRVEPDRAEALCLDHRMELRLPKAIAPSFRKVKLHRARE